jgi:hypothetical protein
VKFQIFSCHIEFILVLLRAPTINSFENAFAPHQKSLKYFYFKFYSEIKDHLMHAKILYFGEHKTKFEKKKLDRRIGSFRMHKLKNV